jgi:hypothetical protein
LCLSILLNLSFWLLLFFDFFLLNFSSNFLNWFVFYLGFCLLNLILNFFFGFFLLNLGGLFDLSFLLGLFLNFLFSFLFDLLLSLLLYLLFCLLFCFSLNLGLLLGSLLLLDLLFSFLFNFLFSFISCSSLLFSLFVHLSKFLWVEWFQILRFFHLHESNWDWSFTRCSIKCFWCFQGCWSILLLQLMGLNSAYQKSYGQWFCCLY